MSSTYRYQIPVEQTQWKFEGQSETILTWEYEDGRSKLLALYDKGKKQQWDAATRIDWSQDLDPENPMMMDDRAVQIWGSPVWERLTEKERTRVRHHLQAQTLSQFMHGEQGALIATAKIVQTVPGVDAKFYAATQVMDEARHVEAYARLLHEKFELSDTERDEREEFVVEACYHMRDRFNQREVWETLGLPVEECIQATLQSDQMKQFRTRLFTRIVPTVKDIGLWGQRVQKAYADMGVLDFATIDAEALLDNDAKVAEEFDARRVR